MDEQLNTEKNILRELEDLIKHHSLKKDKNIYILITIIFKDLLT